MSSASKSKKDKKATKESSKASSKSLLHVTAGGGVAASGYNPLSGTFHSIETAPLSSPPQVNGRFRNIDETDNHNGNSSGAGVEYDSISNNGSWSGESEDHKDKVSNPPVVRQETAVPGGDNDKREKIRQKNEKKHQRQKEKRAQELHERCSGYLMSRKLEALAQQLVAMGFPHERATMALILNEGRVEQSVVWLLEGAEEEASKHSESHFDNGNILKIDISEELARMAEMEIRCRCSRQDVERAIVAHEGDLEKAEESLRVQKEDTVPPKQEESVGPLNPGNGKQPVTLTSTQNLIRMPQKAATTIIQQPRNDRDFNYTKAGVEKDTVSKNVPTSEKLQQKMEWGAKPQQSGSSMPVEKRWPVTASASSASFSLSPALQAAAPVPVKPEARFVAAVDEPKNHQQSMGSIREPVMLMQRPQSTINGKIVPTASISSSSLGTATNWYPYSVDTLKSNGFIPAVSGIRNINPNELYNQFSSQPASQQPFMSSNASMESLGTSRISSNGFWNRTNASSSPTIAAASSLGLFSGFGGNVTSGLDWNSGSSMAQLDYNNIDWSLERGGGLSMTRPSGGMWAAGMNETPGGGGGGGGMQSLSSSSMRRVLSSNGSKVPMMGGFQPQDGGVGSSEASSSSSASNSREWTSPFEERDLFSLPRQFVSSPSL